MSPLDRKLLRNLWRIKGQAAAIALVVAMGVLMVVMMSGLVTSLDETRRAYYERYRLADVFAPVVRAPERRIAELAAMPGVAAAEGRIVGPALVSLRDEALPYRAQAVSLPAHGAPRLNDIHLTDGRRLDPNRGDEILLLRGFALAHGLRPGDALTVTMNGARRSFRIVGLADAPEFLYTTAPGEIAPDDARYAVIWMSRPAIAAAFDMEGAFNEALLALGRNASPEAVIAAADRVLAPYGAIGAYGLEDQASNRFIRDEIASLRTTSLWVSPFFLGVAAFLLYIVVSRIVQAEREQIGLLKAFGYTGAEVGAHYFKLVFAIATGGALIGCLLGVAAGRWLIEVYLLFFKFPFLVFQVDPASFATGMLVSVAAASAGGLFVLRGVFALTPAAAMRPPTPPDYSRAGAVGRALASRLDQPSRMVLRRLIRQPGRMAGAAVGVAAGMALSVSMLGVMESFDRTLDLSFGVIDRSDATVTFTSPLSEKTILELRRIDGVIAAEPVRVVPAVLRNGLRTYRGAISGLVTEPVLNRAVDNELRSFPMREDGVILGKALAEILEIGPGEPLTIEVREGRRPVLSIPVAGVAETLLGSPAYMDIAALDRALREPGRVSGAHLRIDAARSAEIYRKLKDMPTVAGVSLREDARAALQRMMDTSAGAVRYIMTAIAAIISFGIVYNAARIAYAERAADLASLRVMGFTNGETAFVLLGELAVVILAALPLGALLGHYLSYAVSAGFSNDLYQIPVEFNPGAVGRATLAVLAAAIASGWLVSRDMIRADLVSALKTRE